MSVSQILAVQERVSNVTRCLISSIHNIIRECVPLLYALRTLRAHGMNDKALTLCTKLQSAIPTHTFIVVLAARDWIKINAILNNTIK